MTIKKLIPLDLVENVVRNVNKQVKIDKERLSMLNSSLRDYLEKVKKLQDLNSNLLNEINVIKQRLISNEIKANFGKCLDQACSELNKECESISVLNLAIKNNSLKIDSYRKKLVILEDEKINNDQKVINLVNLNEKNLKEKSELMKKITNVKEIIENSKNEKDSKASILEKLNDSYDHECLKRIDNELQIQRLLEEIQFMKVMHQVLKKEMLQFSNVKVSHETKDYTIENSIKQLRQDLETVKKLNLEKLEKSYYEKLDDLRFKSRDQYLDGNEQVESLNDHLKSSIFEMAEEIKTNKFLEAKLDDLNLKLNSGRDQLSKKLNEQDFIINDLKGSVKELRESFDLKKVHLATEIQIYKRLLEKLSSFKNVYCNNNNNNNNDEDDVEIPIILEIKNKNKNPIPNKQFEVNNFESFLRSKFYEKHGEKCSFTLEYLNEEESTSDESDSLQQIYEETFVNNN